MIEFPEDMLEHGKMLIEIRERRNLDMSDAKLIVVLGKNRKSGKEQVYMIPKKARLTINGFPDRRFKIPKEDCICTDDFPDWWLPENS